MAPYATPSDLWTLALPPDALFNEQNIEPGPWTEGSGLGIASIRLRLALRVDGLVLPSGAKEGAGESPVWPA